MKLKNFLLVCALFALASCGKYPDGTSVHGAGAWIIPVVLIIGIVIFGYRGYQAWASGSITGGSSSNPEIVESDERVPVYKVPGFIYAAILLVALIVYFIVQNADK